MRVPRPARASEREEREARLKAEPLIRALPDDTVRRWTLSGTWLPPESNLICRHVSLDGSRRVTTNQRTPPRGYRLEYDVGALRRVGLPGTAKLIAQGGSYRTLPLEEDEPPDALLLGYVELAPLPLFDSLILAVHRGQHVLVAGEDDPIAAEVEPIGGLGFVDSYPMNPRHSPHAELRDGPTLYGALPLTRAVDRRARRHVYAVGPEPARGELAGELGALDAEPSGTAVPVWITPAGWVVTDRYEPEQPARQASSAVRWVGAPVAWRGFAPFDARARASAKRALDLAKGAVKSAPSHERSGEPVGYLSPNPGTQRTPVYSAIHAVTGDQLLTATPLEAADMGYGPAVLLGYALAVAPLTGSLRLNDVTVPWASRFGHNARR
jgi:hypothetical protein